MSGRGCGALARAGASRPVLVVFEAAAPALIIGLLYLVRSVTGGDWPVAGLGLWLVIVAAVSGYAGPRTVRAINALAVGRHRGTSVTLTRSGRDALDHYTTVLQRLLESARPQH